MSSLLDILSAPIVRNVMSVRSESSGPYAVAFRAYEHVKFVAVLRGSFYLWVEGETKATTLRPGDCYMLTNGADYRVFNADVPETDAATFYATNRKIDGVVRWGAGRVDTVTIGCRATFNPQMADWLRDRLPPFIRIPGGTAAAVRFCSILTLLCGDPERAPGAAFVADRFVGILLAEVLRHVFAAGGVRRPQWFTDFATDI